MNVKTVLIHSIVFSPDGVSTAYLYNDIALKLQDSGFKVIVLTTTPHYNIVKEHLDLQPMKKRFYGLFYMSSHNGIDAYHVAQRKYSNSLLRIIGFLYWHLMSFLIAISLKKIDVIISPSPPLSIAVLNIIIAKFKKSKTIYNIQEIYPDLLIESGKLNNRLICNFLRKIEKYIYNKTDILITIDPIFYNTISSRVKNLKKLFVIPNFVDTDLYKPINSNNIDIYPEHFAYEKFLKVMYAGNIGLAQDWDILLNIANNLKEEKVVFFVIGDGVMKDYLQQYVNEKKLFNIKILPYQKRDKMPELLSYADIHFIFMSNKTEMQGFPSKVYTIMACAKPLLISSGENTPIHNFLHNEKFAHCFSSSDIEKRIKEITNFLKTYDSTNSSITGEYGRRIVLEHYSKEVVISKYTDIITKLTSL